MRNDELYHWGLKKGEEASNHRYSRRELVGTKNGKNIYKYFYDAKTSFKDKAAIKSRETKYKLANIKNKVENAVADTKLSMKKANAATKKTFNKIKNSLVTNIKKTVAYEQGKRKANYILHHFATKENNYASKAELEVNKRKNKEIKKYKYVAKVKTKDGKFRYFYNKNELEAYYKDQGSSVEKQLLNRAGLKQDPNFSEQDELKINKHFKDGGVQYTQNCYSCSLAWDLRRRGFDVEAIKDADGETGETAMQCYKNNTDYISNDRPLRSDQAATAFANEMRKGGDNSHGLLMVRWKDGSGHMMNYEVVNGKVIIRDSQTSSLYREERFAELFACTDIESSAESVAFCRTDDKELDESILKYVQKST